MKKIFIIEDDEQLLENIITLLEVEGFKAYSSDLGKNGIELIREILPDLVLCDIQLPDINGYEIIKELKLDIKTCNIPFVFLTAKVEAKDFRNGMNLGADDYLTKPYDAKELIEVINTRISHHENLQFKDLDNFTPTDKKLTNDDFIFIRTTKQVKKIFIKSIICINADAEYSELFLDNGSKILVRKLIKTWEEILPEKNFLRIHKSTIINLDFIQKIEKWFNSSYKIQLQIFPEPIVSSRRFSTNIRSRLLH